MAIPPPPPAAPGVSAPDPVSKNKTKSGIFLLRPSNPQVSQDVVCRVPRFGEVRVAILALLTFTALSGFRSCGVVTTKFSGHAVTFRKFAHRLRRYSEIFVCLDSHLIWQSAKSDVECGSAVGVISHKGLLTADISLALFYAATNTIR
jgi:hypothetical protein